MTIEHLPQEQSFPFDSSKYSELRKTWDWSRQRISDLKRALDRLDLPDAIATIAVSGSLARMEAHRGSDLDLLIVLDDQKYPLDLDEQNEVHSAVWEGLQHELPEVSLQRPLSDGIFSVCARWSTLVDSATHGMIDEPMTVFGHRVQLLIDAQPLLNEVSFGQLRTQIVEWYSELDRGQTLGEAGRFYWLRHDLLRYWHSLCSRAAWINPTDPQKAWLVNLKLRSSRLLLISAALIAIRKAHATSGFSDDAMSQLLEQLCQTPLQRIATVVTPDELQRLLNAWQSIWRVLAESTSPQSGEMHEAHSASDDLSVSLKDMRNILGPFLGCDSAHY